MEKRSRILLLPSIEENISSHDFIPCRSSRARPIGACDARDEGGLVTRNECRIPVCVPVDAWNLSGCMEFWLVE